MTALCRLADQNRLCTFAHYLKKNWHAQSDNSDVHVPPASLLLGVGQHRVELVASELHEVSVMPSFLSLRIASD